MNKNEYGFEFADPQTAASSHDSSIRVVRMPRGITRKRKLLASLAATLQFPSYFGHNWDALEELLNDLSWLNPHEIVKLVHSDLPCSDNPGVLSTYLEILQQRVRGNSAKRPIKLLVSFPIPYQAVIQNSLASAEESS